jgi:hypothetical protein
MKKVILILSAAIVLFASFKIETGKKRAGIFKGPETSVYQGKAWTWVELDKEGKPVRTAISINEDALNSVKIGNGTGSGHHQHNDDNNIVLNFHPKANGLPFKHVWLNWNPDGHEPQGVYTKPHFDVHFYLVDVEERETFTDTVKLDASLPADYVPANHLGVHPMQAMGKHYVDLKSPELSGTPFTQTYIYGSYDSRLAFLEPMITLDFLKTTASFERSLPQPAKFQNAGYYPTKMRITKSKGVVNVILEGFVYQTAS